MSAADLPILIDCDEVLADFVGAVLEFAPRRLGANSDGTRAAYRRRTRAEVTQWDIGKALGWPDFAAEVTYRVNAGLCERLDAVPGAIDWLRRVENEFGTERVLVCTSPWNASWAGQRAAWLEARGVPIKRQVQCSAKHWHSGFLIDDAQHHICGDDAKGYPARPKGTGFLIAAPWNSEAPGVPRGSLEDALKWLRKVAV